MADPITAGIIAGLAAQKFAEGAAGKAAEKLVEKLWDSIVSRFAGRKKTEENLATIAGSKGQAPEALLKVATVLEGEFVEDEDWRSELEAIVREIQTVEPDRVMELLVGIKTTKGIKAKDVIQESSAATEQRMLVDVEAESLEFGNLTQKQG
jgi:hypothetical protein